MFIIGAQENNYKAHIDLMEQNEYHSLVQKFHHRGQLDKKVVFYKLRSLDKLNKRPFCQFQLDDIDRKQKT